MTIETIKKILMKPGPSGVILFLGAGFSRGAVNSDKNPLPTAKAFSESISRDLNLPKETPLTISSEIYNSRESSDTAILNLLKKTFSTTEITQEQKTILSYPWKRIYTTNYDDAAEQFPAPNGSRPDSYDRTTVPLSYESDRRSIIHLNGYVGNISRKTAVSDFMLTLSSYMDSSLFNTQWASLLRQDIILASSVVFVGYSMYDPDISQIIGRNPEFKKKIYAIQHDEISEIDEIFLRQFGNVVKVGTTGLAEAVGESLKIGLTQ